MPGAASGGAVVVSVSAGKIHAAMLAYKTTLISNSRLFTITGPGGEGKVAGGGRPGIARSMVARGARVQEADVADDDVP
jgi:hypothetical protein